MKLSNRKYYIGLDLLKIISTILIVFHHFQQVTGCRFSAVNFYGGGFYYGRFVELFFIISGFLVYEKYKIIINNSINFKQFYFKNYLKYYINIFITIIIFIIIKFVEYELFDSKGTMGRMFNFFDIFISSIGLQNIGIYDNPMLNNPTWYCSVLMICILIFWVLIKLAIKYKIDIKVLFIIMIFVGLYIKYQNINFFIFNIFLYRGYVAFYLGCLINSYLQSNDKLNKGKIEFNVFLISMLILIIIISIIKPSFVNEYYTYTFIFFPIIVYLFVNKKFEYVLNNNKIIKFLSKHTFIVFIWHSIFLEIIFIFKLHANILTMLLFTIFMFVFSIVYEKVIGNRINIFINKIMGV